MQTVLRIILVPAILLATAASHCMAADKMKPGLWEVSIKSDAMKAMPKIPPEQLEKMKQMGIKMPDMQNGAMINKVCYTQEMVDMEKPPAGDNQSCQTKNFTRSGASFTAEMTCNMPNMTGTGVIKGSFTQDSMTSVSDFKGTMNGQPISHHTETSGKWLGSDCGDVKPFPMPKKK